MTPGRGEAKVDDAVYTDSPYADSSELITGYYAVEVDDEATARTIAAMVPSGGTVEWRKVFPTMLSRWRRTPRWPLDEPAWGSATDQCRVQHEFRAAWPRIVRVLAAWSGSLDDAEEYAAEAVARALDP